MRGEFLVRVVAEVRRCDLHAREVLGALLQIEDLRLGRTVLHLDRRERIAAVLADSGADLVRGNVQHPRELPDLAQANAAALRKVRAPDLDGGPRDVRDQHLAVPIEDRTARSLHADVAALVVLSGAEQLLAVQDLERPESQEERGKDGERHHPEQADPQRQFGREAVGLFDSRVRWEEAS